MIRVGDGTVQVHVRRPGDAALQAPLRSVHAVTLADRVVWQSNEEDKIEPCLCFLGTTLPPVRDRMLWQRLKVVHAEVEALVALERHGTPVRRGQGRR